MKKLGLNKKLSNRGFRLFNKNGDFFFGSYQSDFMDCSKIET